MDNEAAMFLFVAQSKRKEGPYENLFMIIRNAQLQR